MNIVLAIKPKWAKLMRQCRAGVVEKLVFDEVSRFSRNAEEAITEYKELYNLGIEMEFLKEPHINSEIYRQASEKKIEITIPRDVSVKFVGILIR